MNNNVVIVGTPFPATYYLVMLFSFPNFFVWFSFKHSFKCSEYYLGIPNGFWKPRSTILGVIFYEHIPNPVNIALQRG